MLDVTKFVTELHEYIERAVSPIAKRLVALEAREPVVVKGEPGKDGVSGRDGASATDEQVSAAVEAYLRANPPAKGEKGDVGPGGKDGSDGKDGDGGRDGLDGKDGIDGARGERGEKGLDGRDAEVSYDDILKAVEETHERMVAKYVLDLERRGSDAVQRAIDKLPVPKDGKDGVNGRDGKDGMSFDGLQREYVPETHEIRERWTNAGVEKELRYPAGGIRPGGYWKDGIKALSGQAWTNDGILWIAVRDTTDKPSLKSADWFIGARKGKDGVDGKNGKDAQPVQLKAANGA